MKRLVVLTACLLLYIGVSAQASKYSNEFGKVTQHEMTMEEYDNDVDADAVMIYKFGDYSYRGSYSDGIFYLVMNIKTKIKILEQSGVNYANFEIPFYKGNSGWEVIESVEGTTYNYENGLKETKLEKSNIFEENINDNVKVKKIAFPDVRAGSVVEISYSIVTPYYFNMRAWYFQERIPVVLSKLKYRAIPYYEYQYLLKGVQSLDNFDIIDSEASGPEISFGSLKYREKIYNFGMNDVPAFKDEEFIASVNDYRININFQLSKIIRQNGSTTDIMTTWSKLSDDFMKHNDFGKYMRSAEKQASKIMNDIDFKNEPDEKKIEIITNFVKSKYSWNGMTSKFAEVSMKDFLRSQTGSTGNINLLLAGLLKSAGIEAYPIILSTRDNGAISMHHPFQHFFNYVVVMAVVDDRLVLLDGTEPLLYYSVIPVKCMNVPALVVKPKSEQWIILQQNAHSLSQKSFRVNINPATSISEVDVRQLSVGPIAHRHRSIHKDNDENITNYLKEEFDIDTYEIDVNTSGQLNKPFIFKFKMQRPVEMASNKLFINPFCNLSLIKNPFTQPERTLPVDLIYLREEAYYSVVEIPEGYKVEYMPESQSVENDLISFTYHVSESNNLISVNAGYKLKEYMIPAEKYEQLKSDFNKMIKTFTEMLVLVEL